MILPAVQLHKNSSTTLSQERFLSNSADRGTASLVDEVRSSWRVGQSRAVSNPFRRGSKLTRPSNRMRFRNRSSLFVLEWGSISHSGLSDRIRHDVPRERELLRFRRTIGEPARASWSVRSGLLTRSGHRRPSGFRERLGGNTLDLTEVRSCSHCESGFRNQPRRPASLSAPHRAA
jgi:hypothetical protein